jgi:glutaredoxin-related protein
MLKIYGSMLCPDCARCREDLERAQVEHEYLDFANSVKYLKEFLAIRDGSSVFDGARANGSIGIPCIVREDGTVTLSWEEFL